MSWVWFSFVGCQCHIFDGTGGNSTLCHALYCPAGSRLSEEFVLLVLRSESCFLPQEDDALSVLLVGAGERGLPLKVTSHSASWWLNDANTGLKMLHSGLRDSAVFCETDVVLEMNKMICKKFWTRHMFLLWSQNKTWHAVLWCRLRLNFDLPYFSGEVLLI